MAEKETKSCSEGCEEMTDNEVIKALEVCAYSDACLKECPFFNYKSDCTKKLTASALKIIKRHQSDVAPVRHGRWERNKSIVQCDVCGFGLFPDGYFFENGECTHANEQNFRLNFCPNCGAKMDGGEENDY